MSRLKQKILNDAKLSDRRFGKGIVCRLIHNDLVIDVMNKNGILPAGTILNDVFDTSKVSYSVSRGLYFAIPISVLDKLQAEIEAYTIETNASMVAFLKQNLVMVRIPAVKCPNQSAKVNPNRFDILIETADVSESLDGIFVPRRNFDYTVNPSINDG